MGEVATRLADRVYVTDDNPRTEPPARIRRAILEAAPNAIEIGDRREAIATAIAELEAGDLLVIAGKGHETGQIIGTETFPFDDAAIARELAGGPRPSSLRRAG
jgi:UDP-N-acetylmuramoyl-L-alanyl-D-glutamate--2,6-diaminopimelate ligase